MIGKIIDVALILVVLLYGVFTFGKCGDISPGYTDGQIQGLHDWL